MDANLDAQKESPKPNRFASILVSCLALFLYSVPILGAGHGVIPLGYLIAIGSLSGWGSALFLARLGIVIMFFSSFVPNQITMRFVNLLGLLMMAVSGIWISAVSDKPSLPLLMLIPFFILIIVKFVGLIRLHRKA